MALPVNIRDIMSSGSRIREEREKPVRLAVWVERDAPESLVNAVRGALLPQTANAKLRIDVVQPGVQLPLDPLADAVIGLVGGGKVIGGALASARDANIPAVAVVWTEASAEEWGHALGHPTRDVLVDGDPEHLVDKELGEWLAENLSGKRLALANNFSFMRRAVAVESVQATSMQNAAIGAAPWLPGADMPLMTANQMKMVLQIAAAYGQALSGKRVRELAAVLGGAFALRAAARTIVGFIPGFGWALRGGIGYSGTLAMGYAALEYFEAGGSAEGLATKMREARERLRRDEAEPPIMVDAVAVEDVAEPAPPAELPAASTGDASASGASPQ
jgi:uncharacterized protein (DUF697 family)